MFILIVRWLEEKPSSHKDYALSRPLVIDLFCSLKNSNRMIYKRSVLCGQSSIDFYIIDKQKITSSRRVIKYLTQMGFKRLSLIYSTEVAKVM